METIARYENTSQVINNAEQDIVQLFPNLCRDRVNLAASIKDVLPVRDALLALRDCITSKLYTSLEEIQLASLDPLITVTQERIFFEAFSLDEASYGRVSIQLEALNSIDVLTQGCTNIEFSEKLRQGLQQLRSSQPAWLAVERKAFSLNTGKSNIIEKRIVLPPSWMRGFLEVQASLQRPATTVSFAPGDLLNILTYLKKRKENVSPRSLRFQFEPNSPPKAVV
ncbi:MAG: zinc finger SWIM domain-containing protein, partial [bacterium]